MYNNSSEILNIQSRYIYFPSPRWLKGFNTVQFGSGEYQLMEQCKRKIDCQSPINATCDVSQINGLNETKLLSGFSSFFSNVSNLLFFERQRPPLKWQFPAVSLAVPINWQPCSYFNGHARKKQKHRIRIRIPNSDSKRPPSYVGA